MVLPSVIITTAEQSTQIHGIIEYNIVNEYTASSFWGDSRKEVTPLFEYLISICNRASCILR